MTPTVKGWSVFLVLIFSSLAVGEGDHGQGTPAGREKLGDLNNQAFCILQNRCAKCHDEATAQAAGQKVRRFGGILNFKTLLDSGLVSPRNPEDSKIYKRMASVNNPMPPNLPTDDARLSLHQAETETIRRWIAEGATAFPANPNCVDGADTGDVGKLVEPKKEAQTPVVRPEDILMRVTGDIIQTEPYFPRRSEYVYFSLAHLRGSPADNEVTRRMYRDALTQQINNTSRSSKIVVPEQIDKEGYLFRVRPADMGWSMAAFNLIKGTDSAFDSKVIDGRKSLQITQKMVDSYISRIRNSPGFASIDRNDPRVPAHLRMMASNPNDPRIQQEVAKVLKQYQEQAVATTVSLDHFVAKSAQWEGYQALLQLPDTQNEVLGGYDWRQLLTEAAAGRTNLPVHKYFMRVSRADRNQTNREATYFNFPARTRRGALNLFQHVIMSSNYDDNLRKNNASRYPLTGVQDAPETLKATPNSHDAIGQLPNGLVAFFRHNDKGETDAEIIEKGPVFCMSCHTLQNGVFEFTDQGQNILDRIASGEIPPQYHAKVQRLYQGDQQLSKDLALFTDKYKTASQAMGLATGDKIHPELRNPEFVSKGSKANALAFTSQSGGNAVVLVSEKQANNISVADMARRAGTSPDYLRMVMGRRDIQVLLGNPGRVEEIQPDLFNAAMPAIMEAIPLVDPRYGQVGQGRGGQFSNYYGPGYSTPGPDAYGNALPQGTNPRPIPYPGISEALYMIWGSIVLGLTVGILPSALGFECSPEKLAKLAVARRGVASIDVTPEGKEGTAQQLRLLLPELGRVPSSTEVLAHAEKILAGQKPVIVREYIPQGNPATWRAGELMDGLERMGVSLTPEQKALAYAYRRSSESSLVRGASLSLETSSDAQVEQIRQTLQMMGISPIVEGRTLHLSEENSSDSLALSRAIYLLRDWGKAKKDFGASFEDFVNATDDLITSRAKPQEITAIPEIYRRWESHSTQGHNAIRFANAKMYKDPTGRMHVIEIPERTISAGHVIPAKTEAILLVPLSETPSPGANIGMRVSFDKGKGVSTDARTCVACHRTSGNQLYTIIPAARVGDEKAYGEGQLIAGPNFKAKFISSSALREHLATPAPQ